MALRRGIVSRSGDHGVVIPRRFGAFPPLQRQVRRLHLAPRLCHNDPQLCDVPLRVGSCQGRWHTGYLIWGNSMSSRFLKRLLFAAGLLSAVLAVGACHGSGTGTVGTGAEGASAGGTTAGADSGGTVGGADSSGTVGSAGTGGTVGTSGNGGTVGGASTGGAVGLSAPGPVFTLDFSDGSNAIDAQGKKIPASVEGSFTLQNTPHGKAMLSGPGAGYLHFPAKGIINPQSGTVEMWVSPLDWNGAEQKYHVFFDARGLGDLYLYKYYQGGLLMLSAPQSGGPYYAASADIQAWKPGQWHFIAGTWSPFGTSVYVDGKLVNTTTSIELPSSISGDFEIGDDPWSISRTSKSLVTDVRIYDHALSAEHIAAHYAGDYSKVVPLSGQVLAMKLAHDASTHDLQASLSLNGADVADTVPAPFVNFSLWLDGKPVGNSSVQYTSNGVAQANLPTASLKPGTYQVVANVTAGTQHAQISRDFVVPDLSWMGNTLGKQDVVLPPWTPVTTSKLANGFDISCWGRTYRFLGGPLPVAIFSQGQSMLAHPMALNVVSNGKTLPWQNESIKLIESSATHAVLEGQADAATPAGTLHLTTDIRIEYDGLATLSLHLQKPSGWQPDAVSLVIPMRQQNAIYYHRAESAGAGPAGLVPAGTGVVDQTSFQPFAWLGDDARGLFWFCETAQFWPNWQDNGALQIVRNSDSVAMTINLQKGQTLPDDWTYDFGIEATPVKPIPADWRKWRLAPAAGAKVDIMWPTPTKNSEKYYGYPEAANDAAFANTVKEIHDKGEAAIPYSSLTFVSGASPEYRWFAKQWDIGLHDTQSSDVASFNAPFNAVSTQQQTLQDFLTWKDLEFMKQFGLDGYYFDNSVAWPSTYADAGYGWQDGDVRRPTYGILANRELYRRVYAVVKAKNPNAFVMAHMSGKVTIPFLAYADAMLNGEQFRGKVKDSYMDVMSLGEWRALYSGRQWGVMGYFLPEFDAAHGKLVAPTRGLAALVMLHDVAVWPEWSNLSVWNAMYSALDKFGYVDSTFIPYWSPNPPASTNMKDVYVSAYRRADGRDLLVVGNTSREPRSGTVTLNPSALGVSTATVLSWPDGTPLSHPNGTIQISMDGLDYRLLLVGKPPAN